ncbi:MAG TPA: right-handed parallel beta-helix repeat-containing protein [Candidatus Sumerlaeota bacterium]|nr:right-handed parallel beta-helix repeat-containing protein [Candidatus Sumerlaeota bacterium]
MPTLLIVMSEHNTPRPTLPFLATLLFFFMTSAIAFTENPLIVAPDGSGTHTTIQSALDAAPHGGTIHVRPGVYRESLWISRPVGIFGTDSARCILETPEGAAAAIVIMECGREDGGRVEIRSLTIKGPGRMDRIYTVGFDYIDKDGSVFVGGIIRDSPADRTGFPRGDRITTFDGKPLLFSEMARCIEAWNTAPRSIPILLDLGRYSKPMSLMTERLLVPGGWPRGIMIINSHADIGECTVRDMGGDGIWVGGKEAKASIISCKALNNRNAGIAVSRGAMAFLTGNICEGNAFGLLVENTASVSARRNLGRKNSRSGMMFQGASDGWAQDNQFTDNKGDGITCSGARTHPTIVMNTCMKNGRDGISVRDGASALVRENNIWRNLGNGIGVYGDATRPMLLRNQARNNELNGIYISDAGGIVEENTCVVNNGGGIHKEGNKVTACFINNTLDKKAGE